MVVYLSSVVYLNWLSSVPLSFTHLLLQSLEMK